MLVYRIERPFSLIVNNRRGTNYGPYCGDFVHENIHDFDMWNEDSYKPITEKYFRFYHTGHTDRDHPGGYDDRKLVADIIKKGKTPDDVIHYSDEHAYGFESLEQLYHWFPDDNIFNLCDKGFYIAVFESDEFNTFLGDRQVIFNMEKANQVDCIFIDDFIKDAGLKC